MMKRETKANNRTAKERDDILLPGWTDGSCRESEEE